VELEMLGIKVDGADVLLSVAAVMVAKEVFGATGGSAVEGGLVAWAGVGAADVGAVGVAATGAGVGVVLATILAHDIAAGFAEIGLIGTIGFSFGLGGGGGVDLADDSAFVAFAADLDEEFPVGGVDAVEDLVSMGIFAGFD